MLSTTYGQSGRAGGGGGRALPASEGEGQYLDAERKSFVFNAPPLKPEAGAL